MKYDWILFDADNTLFDFHASSYLAFFESFKRYKIEADESFYERFKQINYETWKAYDENKLSHEDIKQIRFSRLFQQIGISGIDPLEFNALYFKNIVKFVRYIDGALDILDYFYTKINIAIITNGMKEVQRPRLKSSGLDKYFKAIIVSGEIGHSKPNLSFFKFVHNLIGEIDKRKVLVVGDSLYADIKGGNNFGFDTVWFNPNTLERENGIVPDFEIRHLSELTRIAEI